jgi:antirestriction protein ArdC
MTTTARPKAKARKAYDGPTAEEKLCADLVALMEAGTAPWRREWQGHQGEHRNLLTGHEYRGMNPLLLELGSLTKAGSQVPLWLGGAQAKGEGWFPRKGCTASRIVRPQLNQREEEQADGSTEVKAWVSYKIVPVFNAADLVGATDETAATLAQRIAAALSQAPEAREPAARLEAAEAVLETWTVPTAFGGVRAFYSPSRDRIAMPAHEAFDSREAFAATWAHEMIHSTGHDSRLKRDLDGGPTARSYAREELVAELGAVIVCRRLAIGSEFANHAAYLSSWAGLLQEGPKTLFRVLTDARRAADLIAPEAPLETAEA